MRKRIPHRAGNVTSARLQTPSAAHRKAALKRRIQDILNGRSRFIIRKVPAAGATRNGGGQTPSGGEGGASPSPPVSREEEKKDRCFHMQHLLGLTAKSSSPFFCPAAASTPRLRRNRRKRRSLQPRTRETRRRSSARGRRRKAGRGIKERRKAERPVRRTELPSSSFWMASRGPGG